MGLQLVVAIVSGGIGAAVVSGVFSVLLWKLNNDKKESGKLTNIVNGLQMLLYAEIKTKGKQYLAEGSVSTENLEDILKMHRIYHEQLQGNGFLDSLMKSVTRLPVQDENH